MRLLVCAALLVILCGGCQNVAPPLVKPAPHRKAPPPPPPPPPPPSMAPAPRISTQTTAGAGIYVPAPTLPPDWTNFLWTLQYSTDLRTWSDVAVNLTGTPSGTITIINHGESLGTFRYLRQTQMK